MDFYSYFIKTKKNQEIVNIAKIERSLGTERARLGTFKGFGTERARLGTFRGFGTERARLGRFNQNFLHFPTFSKKS